MTAEPASLRELTGGAGFRRLLTVRMVGQFGDGLFQAALFSAVFFNPERSTSAGQAAAAFAGLLLPYSVVGPFAGVLLDRWQRRHVLLGANLLRGGLVLLLAALIPLIGATALGVQAVALLTLSCNRFVLSGLSAAQPHVVAEPDLVVANSFSSTLGGGATILGGALAVGLQTPFGDGDTGAARIEVVAAVAYALAAWSATWLGALGPDHPPADDWRSAGTAAARGVAEGARHVRARGPAWRALLAITGHRFFFGLSFVAVLLLYAEDGDIGTGISGLGQVIAGLGVGGLAAAVVTPRATRRFGEARWIVAVFALAAVVQVACGLQFHHASYVVAAAFLGFAAQAAKITLDTLLQEHVEDDFRGRVFSFYDTAFNLSFVAAAGAAALLLPDDGRSALVVVVVAVGYAGTALGYARASRPPRLRLR